MVSENRNLIVITSALLKLRISATRWVPSQAEREGLSITVFNDSSPTPLAQFSDVHAVYWEEHCDLVVEDDDE